jgi:hypothetical protein
VNAHLQEELGEIILVLPVGISPPGYTVLESRRRQFEFFYFWDKDLNYLIDLLLIFVNYKIISYEMNDVDA